MNHPKVRVAIPSTGVEQNTGLHEPLSDPILKMELLVGLRLASNELQRLLGSDDAAEKFGNARVNTRHVQSLRQNALSSKFARRNNLAVGGLLGRRLTLSLLLFRSSYRSRTA